MSLIVRRYLPAVSVCLLLTASSSAYYHFVRFSSSGSPYVGIPEKFDVAALPNRTLQFLISENGPSNLASGDTMAAVVSEIRAAAEVWNAVPTSELRLAYGGIETASTPQATPGIDVIFSDDIPPGLVALGGPTDRGEIRSNDKGTFVSIQRSVLILRRDLSERASWSERFFMSVVHEFGHTLGLQHTLTSSAMSTEVTRSTTRAKALGEDDLAGLSLLYPTDAFLAGTGAISGRVTLGGSGVNMASVVALTSSGPAISTLANPDGTYRLAGLPPGQYTLFVHSLPAALSGEDSPANIVPPMEAAGFRSTAVRGFRTQFHSAGAVDVFAGATASDVNFDVQGKDDSSEISAVQTYGFFGNNPVKPAFFNRNAGQGFLVAAGVNLTKDSAPAPDLSVGVLGGVDSVTSVTPYSPAPESWVQVDVAMGGASDGPRHLLFSTPSDLYVLPSAYRVVSAPPPSITWTGRVDDGALAIAGSNIGSTTRIFFDGAEASIRRAEDGMIVVTPPHAPSGHQSRIIALNPDGQSSLFLEAESPATLSYESSPDVQALSISPAALPAGVNTFIEINAVGGDFVQGSTRVGFGTSDISVRKVWVFSPTRLLAEVTVAPNAAAGTAAVTVTTGLKHFAQTYAFSVQSANPAQVSLTLPSAAGGGSIVPGGWVTTTALNLPSPAPGISVFVGGQAVSSSVSGSTIAFQVPPGFGSGLAVVSLQIGSAYSLPALILVEPGPPVVSGVFVGSSTILSTWRPARAGDILSAVVYGLAPNGSDVDTSRIQVKLGELEQRAFSVVPMNTQLPGHIVNFVVGAISSSNPSLPMRIGIDGRTSAAFHVPVEGPR